MCRIWGVSFGNEREEIDVAEMATIMYPALVHGGVHAWGWMSYNESDEDRRILWEKTSGRADTRASYQRQIAAIDRDAKWFVGHVRYATHGSPEDNRNNHPIAHGDIIGVHNGILRNHDEILSITGREDPKTEVDSEAIFAAVNRWGPKKGLARIEGDMVTIYASIEKPNILHIGRTHGRQLTIGWTDRGNLIFASEEQALLRLEPDVKFINFSTVSENRLLILRNGKIIQRFTFAEPIQRYVPPRASVLLPRGSKPSDGQVDWISLRAADKATRRGEKLFPKQPRTTEDRRANTKPAPEIEFADGHLPKRIPNQNEKLYFYRDLLLTYSEYEAVLLEEANEISESET